MKLNYDNQNLDIEELELDSLFTGNKAKFLSPKELEKEKEKLKSCSVMKSQKKSVNLRLLASDIDKIKSKADYIMQIVINKLELDK